MNQFEFEEIYSSIMGAWCPEQVFGALQFQATDQRLTELKATYRHLSFVEDQMQP